MPAALGYTDARSAATWLRSCDNRLHQAAPIVPPVFHSRMQRIAEKVIHPIGIRLAVDQLSPEQSFAGIWVSFEEICDLRSGKSVVGIRRVATDHVCEAVPYDVGRIYLLPIWPRRVGFIKWKKLFRPVGKWAVANIVKEGCEADQDFVPAQAIFRYSPVQPEVYPATAVRCLDRASLPCALRQASARSEYASHPDRRNLSMRADESAAIVGTQVAR